MYKVILFSNVKDKLSFTLSKFYLDDIEILKNLGYGVSATNKVSDFFRVNNYNGILIYFYSLGIIPAIIGKIFFKKIIFTGGVDDLQTCSYISLRSFFFIVCYIISDKCNAVSYSDLHRMKQILIFFGLESNKLVYQPHCIDIPDKDYIDSKEKIITTICWLGTIANLKRKGVDRLLILFSKIAHLDYKLYIVGSGIEGKEYLIRMALDLGISNKIVFTGGISHEEKFNLLSKSKFYFQLSSYEGFGLAVLEAIYFKNYIFHSSVGGLVDILDGKGSIINSEYNMDNFFNLFIDVEENLYYNYDFVGLKDKILNSFSIEKRKLFFQNIYNN
jgi:glycosyltransferase involved in cell wall biosynthesis